MDIFLYIGGGLAVLGAYTVAWCRIMPYAQDKATARINGIVYLLGLSAWLFIWIWICWRFV